MSRPPPPSTPETHDTAPNCLRCRNFFITHVVAFPYGCRALGFKSRRHPSEEVLVASGEPCAYFSPKRPAAGKE